MNRYKSDTQIISGQGALNELKIFGARRLLVVTDPYFYENGTAVVVNYGNAAYTYNGTQIAAKGFSRVTPMAEPQPVAPETVEKEG